jgi:hypothetical protein
VFVTDAFSSGSRFPWRESGSVAGEKLHGPHCSRGAVKDPHFRFRIQEGEADDHMVVTTLLSSFLMKKCGSLAVTNSADGVPTDPKLCVNSAQLGTPSRNSATICR